ncbi:MAG: hypothetical protein HUK04_00465 [Bacteroidaceae bacterium]|nr:hypothetical protein [Bacteroidaceae bacterium]
MKIYDKQKRLVLEVEVDDNSYRNRQIMGDNTLTLYYSLPEHVEIPVGSYCVFQNETYTLMRPENFKMQHTRSFEYTVTFDGEQAKAKIWKFRNPVDGRLKFPLTAKPHEHLQMFVDNMNRRDAGWTVGDCISDTEKLINYDHDYNIDALAKMAQEFETEYEIVGKRVSLHKVEHDKNYPLPLSYGRGNGLKPGVGRTSSGDLPPIEVLFVQGGSTNIDRSKYGSGELHLPKNQTIGYDGKCFEDEDGYNPDNARHYMVDDLGLSIRNIDREPSTLAEDSLDRTEDYPKRVGTISDVVEVDKENHFYDFIDDTIEATLNYEDYLIEGETMSVIFQSGELAGREFDVKYYHEAKTVMGVRKKARRFEIVPQEIDGIMMPGDSFVPRAGNTYAIFGCQLPMDYICDNEHRKGAEWDMFRAAVKYLFDNEEQKLSFSGELDGLWAKRDWTNIGGKIRLGGFVRFRSEQFLQEGVLVRIVGIKDYINDPHSPKIELSNETMTAGFSSTIKTLEAQEISIEEVKREALQFTKRRFRDAKETAAMLQAAFSDNFTNAISPVTVETMQLLVGDERLQYRFIDSVTAGNTIPHNVSWNETERQLIAPAGLLQHMTLGIDSLRPSHEQSEYHFYSVGKFTSGILTDGAVKYYLYIKVPESDPNTVVQGEFFLESEPHKFHEGDKYWLLYGILNSEYDGERSFVTLYGFSEILPGRVTTDRVVASDGQSYFDMLNNALKLGDKLLFNIDGDGQLKVKGTIVQSESGDEAYIGCFRGEYNSTYTYFEGDEVTYRPTAESPTSTYRCISKTPVTGVPPTDMVRWQVIAAGVAGADGISPNASFKSTIYRRINTTPATPTGGSYSNPVPTGWSDGIPAGEQKLWASTRIFTTDGKAPQQSAWTTPRQMTDTADFDVEFSSEDSPSAPTGHPNTNAQWSNEATEETIWMATSRKSNGVWEDWQVSRIRGERGEDGTSIKVQGTFYGLFASRAEYQANVHMIGRHYLIDHDEELDADCVVVYTSSRNFIDIGYRTTYTPAESGDAWVLQADGHLYIANGESGWVDIGQFKGDKGNTGAAGANAYVHIKYASSLTENDWTENNGETPGEYIGIYADNNPTDKLEWGLYTWQRWTGQDGVGYEFIYKRTTTATAPATPTTNSQRDGYVPSGWTDDPTGVDATHLYEWVCYRKKTEGTWGNFIGSASNSKVAALWAKYGEKGDTGAAGNYTEIRFAVNGSTTVAPALTQSALNPTGWSETYPTVNKGYYLWMTRAIKTGNGATLISQWTTPVRITPYDGTDGKNGSSPAMVYRGNYLASNTYYGNDNRVDCVKSGDTYYIARTDAGTFSNIAPPNTSKWNEFGASFESVATNLLLAEGANIGDWFISGGKIVSTLQTGSKITLDAKSKLITIYAAATNAPYLVEQQKATTIQLDATRGIIETQTADYNTAYLSPSGIFANRAATQCVSATTGCDQRAAIVGLGNGNLAASSYDQYEVGKEANLVAGVYGISSNSSTAPHYGGYFHHLKACGLTLKPRYVVKEDIYLTDKDTLVVGFTANNPQKVYLPAATREGQTIFVKQAWTGYLRFYPTGGQEIYDDNTMNEYYDCYNGQGLIFHFTNIFLTQGNTTTRHKIWLVSRYKF